MAWAASRVQGDYAMRLVNRQNTPTPWSNIVANSQFGFLVTESGGGYTWAGNSRENKLTSWCNDPVSDHLPKFFTSATKNRAKSGPRRPLPLRDDAEYGIEHRRGSTRFTHACTRNPVPIYCFRLHRRLASSSCA